MTTWPRDEWPYQYAVVPLDRLSIDASYQRPSQPEFIAKCIQPGVFNPRLIAALIGSLRERGEIDIALVDGQQRFLMLKELGYTTAPLLLHNGMSYAEEARLFADMNFEKKTVQAWFHYRALRQAQDPTILAIDRILEASGFRVYSSVQPEDAIGAVATLVAIYNDHPDVVRTGSPLEGPEVLARVLQVLQHAWRNRLVTGWDTAKTSAVLRGLSRYLSAHPDVPVKDVVVALELVNPNQLLQQARERTTGAGSGKGRKVEDIVMAYVEQYQKKMRAAKRQAEQAGEDVAQ